MTDVAKLTLILLPLLILGIIQMVYAYKQRAKLPGRFAILFAVSGVATLAFAVTLWVMGSRMLSA
ncbi:hypothetical protein AGMMS49992_33100 [Clostridia bacterium]|nr:hypothetical protein AGMMS49992_33100 [Clostridia bacterium]